MPKHILFDPVTKHILASASGHMVYRCVDCGTVGASCPCTDNKGFGQAIAVVEGVALSTATYPFVPAGPADPCSPEVEGCPDPFPCGASFYSSGSGPTFVPEHIGSVKVQGSVNGSYPITIGGSGSCGGSSTTIDPCKASTAGGLTNQTFGTQDYDYPPSQWGAFKVAYGTGYAYDDDQNPTGPLLEFAAVVSGGFDSEGIFAFFGYKEFDPDCRKPRTFSNAITSTPCLRLWQYHVADNGTCPDHPVPYCGYHWLATAVGTGGTVTIVPCQDWTDIPDSGDSGTAPTGLFDTKYDCLLGAYSGPEQVGDSICGVPTGPPDWRYDHTDPDPPNRYVHLRAYYGEATTICVCNQPASLAAVPATPDNAVRPLQCPTCGCDAVCDDIRVQINKDDTVYPVNDVLIRAGSCVWQAGAYVVTQLTCLSGVYVLTATRPLGGGASYQAVWRILAKTDGTFDTDVSKWEKVSDSFPAARTLEAIACSTCPDDYSTFCNRYTATFQRQDGSTFTRDYILTFADGDPSAGEWLAAIGGGTNNIQCGIDGLTGMYALEATDNDPDLGDGNNYVWSGPPGSDGSPSGPWTPYRKNGVDWDGTGGLTLLSVTCNPLPCDTVVLHFACPDDPRDLSFVRQSDGTYLASDGSHYDGTAESDGSTWTVTITTAVTGPWTWQFTAPDDGSGCLPAAGWTLAYTDADYCTDATLAGSG